MLLSETLNQPLDDVRNRLVQHGERRIFSVPADLRDLRLHLLLLVHLVVAAPAQPDEVLRHVRAALALRNDVVAVLDRLAADRTPAALLRAHVRFSGRPVLQPPVLAVNAAHTAVFHLHERELVDLNRPVGYRHQPAHLICHVEVRLYELSGRRCQPPFEARTIIEPRFGVPDRFPAPRQHALHLVRLMLRTVRRRAPLPLLDARLCAARSCISFGISLLRVAACAM